MAVAYMHVVAICMCATTCHTVAVMQASLVTALECNCFYLPQNVLCPSPGHLRFQMVQRSSP